MLGKKIFYKKKILIYGLGLSGTSSFQYLSKKNIIHVFDDNSSLKNKKNKSNFLSKNKILKTEFDFIVLSPGIDIKKCKLNSYLLKNKNKIITELDIFYLTFPKNLKITITGTNGKSTTCQMLFNIFKSNKKDVRLVGNIGRSPLLEKDINTKTIFIIEASSYQISYSKFFKTDYAAILNLSPDHLERHGNINQYAKAKLKLIFDQNQNNYSYIENNNQIINKQIHNKKKIITELDIFYLIFPENLKITITGTNGKSSTCQMLFNIFKSNKLDVKLVGNIGKPPLLEKRIKKKQYLLLRHLHIKYHIVNFLKPIMQLF